MTKWYVKDLSKLTGVSVQTLHHYDRIHLLQPSIRLPNGYRLYSASDLSRLQHIIALKFFGFKLTEISEILKDSHQAFDQLSTQAKVLEKKAKVLLEASQVLKGIVLKADNDKSLPWQTILETIEVYRMTEKLEHSWVREIFNSEELKEYATFQAELHKNLTPEKEAAFNQGWSALVEEIKRNLDNEPTSTIGLGLGEKTMHLINQHYGSEYRHLRTKKFERGYGEGIGLDEVGFTPEIVDWLEKAINAYYFDRVYKILAQVGKIRDSEVLVLWHEILDEVYGAGQIERKNKVKDKLLSDKNVSESAKKWLRKFGEMA